MKRYLQEQIKTDLDRKMVFLGGPRQVGKTTIAKSILGRGKGYLNWDVAEDREAILKGEYPVSKLWVFDELHKYRRWRNYLKGIYDSKGDDQKILVTGSARLDYYRFGGDSLQGRYHYLRLHPLSIAELKISSLDELKVLLKLGGFPEPFLSGSEKETRRWSREYRTRVVREDLSSLEQIQDLGSVENLMLRLPALIGSPLSVNGISEDLQISHKTIAKWLSVLERLYALFFVLPFGSPKIKAVKKSRKHYLFDWSQIPDSGARFENLVACHLLKHANFREDTEGYDTELRYFRDNEGREVDFVLLEDNKPRMFVECKSNDRDVSASLKYLKNKFPEVESWQLSLEGKKSFVTADGIRVAPALELLGTLT